MKMRFLKLLDFCMFCMFLHVLRFRIKKIGSFINLKKSYAMFLMFLLSKKKKSIEICENGGLEVANFACFGTCKNRTK